MQAYFECEVVNNGLLQTQLTQLLKHPTLKRMPKYIPDPKESNSPRSLLWTEATVAPGHTMRVRSGLPDLPRKL